MSTSKLPTVLSMIYFEGHGMDVNTYRHNLTTRKEVEHAVEKLQSGEDSSTELEVTIDSHEDVLARWLEDNAEGTDACLCLSSEFSVFFFGPQDRAEIVDTCIDAFKSDRKTLEDVSCLV